MRSSVCRVACAGGVLLVCGCAGPRMAPTPQRPSFSSDASTTASGTLEVESGIWLDDDGAVDTPVVLKWGLAPAAELFLGWSPIVALPHDGPDGAGDVLTGTRLRLRDADSHAPAVALSLATKLPSADALEGLGSGEVDFLASLAATGISGQASLVGYYQIGLLGDPGSAGVDFQHGVAGAIGFPLATDLSGFVELAGVFTRTRDVESVFLTAGAAYPANVGLVLDMAIVAGLTNDAPDVAITLGATANLGAP